MAKPRSAPRQRTCIDCGGTFKGHTYQCTRCRKTERTCIGCGTVFLGDMRACPACRRTERTCAGCGRTFRGKASRCSTCIYHGGACKERACTECGLFFRGTSRTCHRCRATERTCTDCGCSFRAVSVTRCPPCMARKRSCIECGNTFTGRYRRCSACRVREKQCPTCGKTHKASTRKCRSCARKALPLEAQRAQEVKANNARRARKRGAAVAGPVPRETYTAIRASGPCVYCGAAAATVDHVRPLSRGGWEHEDNLVPACGFCNFSKGTSLLTEWIQVARVAYGIAYSSKVAAEHERLTLAWPDPAPESFQPLALPRIRHPGTKLDDEKVFQCRVRAAAGTSITALADELGVSLAAMSRAVNGERWKHVPFPDVAEPPAA